ncbi:MAG: hypothetical protein R3Y60_05680 [bacterium]
MKFNINSNETKYILILSFVLFICSLLSFFPINNLNFILDIFGYMCRYGCLILFFVILNKVIKIIKFQVSINKTGMLYSSMALYVIVYFLSLFCICSNVISLFI